MKKLMTLVLAVCMLLAATTAFAEVVQDEKAPVLVGKTVGDTVVYATVYDAAGTALAITDKEMITLADISALSLNLSNAQFAAEHIVVIEAFSIAVENAEKIEAIFALETEQEVTAVMGSADGVHWTHCEFQQNDDGTIYVEVGNGLVAFCTAAGPAVEVEMSEETVENGNFTPSVAAKPAPEVKGAVLEDGEENVVADVTDYIVITPVSARHYTEDIIVYENLKNAYDDILSAASLEELGIAEGANLVVRDLFHVTLFGESLHDGAFVLKATFEIEEPAAVMVKGAEGWKLLPAENVVVNGDGTVTVTLSETGIVAFLVNAAQTAITSPAT